MNVTTLRLNIDHPYSSERSVIDTAIRQAERQLAKVDPIMKRLIARHGHCPLAEREFDRFICSPTRLSLSSFRPKPPRRSSDVSGCSSACRFKPAACFQFLPRSCAAPGCRRRRPVTFELATHVSDNRLEFSGLVLLDDELVIEKLVVVPGIGRWTAEMFLLFGLKRLDVLAVGDAGLQRAARILYGKKRNSETLLLRVAENWRPIGRSLRGICGGRWRRSIW